jgi:shikimate 5-dehydrogenase
MFKYILPVAVLIGLAACQGGNKAPAQDEAVIKDSLVVDSLSGVVMSVHDEGMAKMMVIRRLKTRVTEIKDSLQKKKADTTIFAATGVMLDSANNAMNGWMHAFDMQMQGKTIAEKKAYLEAEEKKIEVVKQLMLKSIQDAKSLLKED